MNELFEEAGRGRLGFFESEHLRKTVQEMGYPLYQMIPKNADSIYFAGYWDPTTTSEIVIFESRDRSTPIHTDKWGKKYDISKDEIESLNRRMIKNLDYLKTKIKNVDLDDMVLEIFVLYTGSWGWRLVDRINGKKRPLPKCMLHSSNVVSVANVSGLLSGDGNMDSISSLLNV